MAAEDAGFFVSHIDYCYNRTVAYLGFCKEGLGTEVSQRGFKSRAPVGVCETKSPRR